MEDRIVVDPKVCHGRPVIRGTRTPASIVVGSLAAGMTLDDLQREYLLTIEDVRAALRYAADLLDRKGQHALPR